MYIYIYLESSAIDGESAVSRYIYIYIHTHIHIHSHILYIHVFIYLYICIYKGSRVSQNRSSPSQKSYMFPPTTPDVNYNRSGSSQGYTGLFSTECKTCVYPKSCKKHPLFHQKSPILHRKSHIFHQWSPTYGFVFFQTASRKSCHISSKAPTYRMILIVLLTNS